MNCQIYTQQQTRRFVLMLILLELFSIFARTKFIINFNKVHYKISTMVAFCPGGLLSVHRSLDLIYQFIYHDHGHIILCVLSL